MAALGKVSEGPHSSTDCQLLDLQVAGLQNTRVCQYPRPEKLMAWPGIEPGSPPGSKEFFGLYINFELTFVWVERNVWVEKTFSV